MNINATLINLYIVCSRQCWLHANGINMEHTSDIVYDGKLLHESSYPQRADRYSEVELNIQWKGIRLTGKVDYYDRKDKVIHETKRSNKIEEAHEWQLKFYIWLFELNGIDNVIGKIEYPKLRLTSEVFLSDKEREMLIAIVPNIQQTIENKYCPSVINAKICKRCSYYEFCYSGEA
ncbi:MAG: CRISPR-associated protein Cas4 [Weeksellaceae bacterium]